MDEYIRETSDDVSAIIHDLELELRHRLKWSDYENWKPVIIKIVP